MSMPNKQFTTGAAIKWSLIVIVVCLLGGILASIGVVYSLSQKTNLGKPPCHTLLMASDFR